MDVVQFTGRSFDSNLIKVYDFVSKTQMTAIEILKDKDYLSGPKVLTRRPSNRKPLRWRPIGKYLTNDDFEIPNFKSTPIFNSIAEDQSKIYPWYASQLGLAS